MSFSKRLWDPVAVHAKPAGDSAFGPAPLEALDQFALDVRAGLGKRPQRELPCKYLYDETGSALFEVITLLPEYGLARADERLLQRYAAAVVEYFPPPLLVAELGSGNGRKTRWILEALARREAVRYYPIDISAFALARCRQELSPLRCATIVGLEQPYLEGLRHVAGGHARGERVLVLFLGSSIGNFERPAGERFLADLRGCLAPGDGLLLGTDLDKCARDLLLAYDDPAGVTAAFNLNLLARINRELGGDFVLGHFRHEARYNEERRRIEMHLRSTRRQTVSIELAGFRCTLEQGETIWTEACHKYRIEELPEMAVRAGFQPTAQWLDTGWPFAESLWIAE